ncbi:MAG TPA: hypothetical protein VK177_21185 [Flavobacteriales bacterium]|nr:hypothetical protein [Flavobacteriales bacterium]
MPTPKKKKSNTNQSTNKGRSTKTKKKPRVLRLPSAASAVKKAGDLINQLHTIRTTFGPDQEKEKLGILAQFPKTGLKTKKDILAYHEHLLFMLAYPDSAAIQKAVTGELKRLGKVLKAMEAEDPDTFYDKYHATGIAHSAVSWIPSVDISAWITQQFPSAAIEPRFDDDFYEGLTEVFPSLVKKAEADSLHSDDFETQDWLNNAVGENALDHLKWINERVLELNCTEEMRDKLYDSLGMNMDLKLVEFTASRTGNILPCRNYHYQTGPLLKGVDLKTHFAQPFISLEKLKGREAVAAIDSARHSLAARSRETDTVTYARDVYRAELEHGMDIYLFEMRPNRKYPIENYLGYVAYKNGVPMAYGGGWIFLDRCEIGLNIFDSFRGGESTLVFVNLMRTYQRIFNVNRFLVPPYQFGENNPEGLKSGAFWFYYRLGYRPADVALNKLATKEAEKLAKKKGYRTSIDILKRFTEAPVELILTENYAKVDLRKLSEAVVKNKLSVTVDELTRMLATYLGNMNAWEKMSVEAVAPMVCLAEGIADWTNDEKEKLAVILKGKYVDEVKFMQDMGAHTRLVKSWEEKLRGV